MSNVATRVNQTICQDCGQKVWSVRLVSQHGYLWLCAACGADALEARGDLGQVSGRKAQGFQRLIERVLGRNIVTTLAANNPLTF